jgi:protein-disulfide isomerase
VSDQEPPHARPDEAKNPSRRNLLFVGGAAVAAAGAWYGWPALERLIPRSFAFEPYDNPTGFRRFSAGPLTTGADVLFGLDDTPTKGAGLATKAVRTDICTALFGRSPTAQGLVRIASFSDYNCPYCRVLSDILQDIEARSPSKVRITWHEWPTLGRSSQIMARAALAAHRQGAYEAFHTSLMRSRFVPTIDYLRELARNKGIDPTVMSKDMRSSGVAWEFALSSALAKIFGFRGTPALVVERTAVAGAIGRPILQALIELERREGPITSCT